MAEPVPRAGAVYEGPGPNPLRPRRYLGRVMAITIAGFLVTFVLVEVAIAWCIYLGAKPGVEAFHAIEQATKRLASNESVLDQVASANSDAAALAVIESTLGHDITDYYHRPLVVSVAERAPAKICLRVGSAGEDGVPGTDDDIIQEEEFVRLDRWFRSGSRIVQNRDRLPLMPPMPDGE